MQLAKLQLLNLVKALKTALTNLRKQKIDCCKLRLSNDGFIYIGESIATLLTDYGMTGNKPLPYDDWHIFGVSSGTKTEYGLCKMRTQIDPKGASVAVSFLLFDLDKFNIFCQAGDFSSAENLLDNNITLKDINVSELILNYFTDTSNSGYYVLANTYIDVILEEEQITNQIDMVELGIYQKSVYDELATDIEKESQCFYISDPENLTNLEKDKILLLRSGNPSIYSFAAEIHFHALMTKHLGQIIDNCINASTIKYQDLINFVAICKCNGVLNKKESFSLFFSNSIINIALTSDVTKIAFLASVYTLYEHAVISNAGTGTSGTALISKYLADFFHQVNFDVFIDDIFYDEDSILIQLAKENHSEESAYNY